MILELKNIIKKFDGIKALDDVSFSIKKGEVHIIAGENGAGKSTLIKIISGIHKPDSGTVVIDGEAVETFNPLIAREKGIATIFQETSIYPQLSVVENVYVNNKIKKNPFFVDWEKMIEGSSKIFKELGEELNLRGNMNGYSAGRCKIVEIARALIKNSRIIIMDEPTSSLSESEVEKLFENIDRLKKAGVTIIYITHKLEEIFKIGDSITVLRDGKCIGTKRIKDISDDELIEMMIGRKIQNYFPNINDNNGDCIFEIKNFNSNFGFFKDLNFELRKGEILGFYGLVGAGRSEFARALFGIDKEREGKVVLKGQELDIKSPDDAMGNGIAYLPEDRQHQGLILEMGIDQNLSLSILNNIKKNGFIDKKLEKEIAENKMKELNISAKNFNQNVKELSGGNQQKVLVGKWLNMNPEILILDEPTRGIDVGTKSEIYYLIKKLAENGVSIILISSELPEVIGMSNRVIVMSAGRIKKIFNNKEITEEKVMQYALVD